MTMWSQQIEHSGVLDRLRELGEAVAEAERAEGLQEPVLEELGRIRTVVTYMGKRFDGASGELIPPGALDPIAAALAAATSSVRQFVAESGEHLANAQGNVNNALGHFAHIVWPTTVDDLAGLRAAADGYREAVSNHLERVNVTAARVHAQATTALAELNGLRSAIDAEKQRLTELTTEQQTQFSTAQEARQTRFDAQVGTQQEQFSTAQETRNQSHNEAQVARQSKFDEIVEEQRKQLTLRHADFEKNARELQEEHQKAVTELHTQHEARAATMLQAIEAHKTQVEKLVGVIGNLGVTSGHKLSADKAQMRVTVWQTIAVSAMLGLIAVAVWMFFPGIGPASSPDNAAGASEWSSFAARVYISLTFGVLAAYAGAHADRYQKVERRHRQLALELEAIGPFLQPLPEEQQQKFRVAIGERSFGRDDASTEPSPTSALDLLKALDTKAGHELIQKALKFGADKS